MAGAGQLNPAIRAYAHPVHDLNERERVYAIAISEGKGVRTAAQLAGYSNNVSYMYKLCKEPRIVRAVNFLREQSQKAILTSRKQVLEGFLEAIEQAKLMSDPAVQIAGWREIGKMCGYYAPEVKEVNVTLTAKRVIGELEVMSDADLLKLVDQSKELIEGESTNLTDSSTEVGN